MKKFKKQFNKVLKELNLHAKAKEGKLTQEDWDAIAAKYTEMYEADFYEDQEAAETAQRRSDLHQAALDLLNDDDTTDPESQDGNGGASGTETDPPAGEETPAMKALRLAQEKAEKDFKEEQKKSKELSDKIKQLEKDPEGDNPKTQTMKNGIAGVKTTEKHLFGIEHDMFSMDSRWNKVAANPAFATLEPANEQTDGDAFRNAVKSYSADLANRYNHLHTTGQLANLRSADLEVDYSDLSNAGLGQQFVVRRQDALIARILSVPTVYDLFPRRYGIQDRELITNAFFGEFSQAYQEGEVYKGDVELQPEMGHVDDTMFKTKFKSMKWIERQYIGYLNKEGSDPVKWSMIEWMVLNIATVLTNEQSERRILGFYVKPESGTAGHKLFGSTGVLYTLVRYIHEHKLLPLEDTAYATYSNTSTVMIDAVQAFLEDAIAKRGNLDGYALYLNRNHKMWYKASVRRAYGKDFDFSGPDANKVPDWDVLIKWVPNMGQNKMMILQKPGNIQCLENLPGEMFKIAFQQDMESVKSWSVWKEGVSPAFVGKGFDSRANLVANDYALQEIFINKPATTLADDATTCDATSNIWFLTQENSTESQNVTDFTGAKAGVVYMIECGDETNPQTVNKTGKFADITSNYVPTAVGDYLMVYYDPTANEGAGRFYELERCVGGTRTVVKTKQPNIPGSR